MQFDFAPALLAGVVATLAMTIVLFGARATGTTSLDIVLLQGSIFSRERAVALGAGFFTHVIVLGGLVFGSLYAFAFDAFAVEPGQAWFYGIALGALNGWLSGLAMSALPPLHPRMRVDRDLEMADTEAFADSPEPVARADKPVRGADRGELLVADPDGNVRVRAPGMFAAQYGMWTPAWLVGAHVAYGIVMGAVYGALAG